jgi:hypothetical protein
VRTEHRYDRLTSSSNHLRQQRSYLEVRVPSLPSWFDVIDHLRGAVPCS